MEHLSVFIRPDHNTVMNAFISIIVTTYNLKKKKQSVSKFPPLAQTITPEHSEYCVLIYLYDFKFLG